MTYGVSYRQILREVERVLSGVDPDEVERLVGEVLRAHTVVTAGAGRVGMAARGFAMRLGHLGRRAYALGDAAVPAIGNGDLLVVASGSGETQTIVAVAEVAKGSGARVALLTGRRDSRLGALADTVVVVPAPSKAHAVDGFASVQPMTTLNEQCLQLLFDAIVLDLMARSGESHETMWRRHSNLE